MAWDETKEGADLKDKWFKIRLLLDKWIPQHQQQLRDLAQRPIDR